MNRLVRPMLPFLLIIAFVTGIVSINLIPYFNTQAAVAAEMNSNPKSEAEQSGDTSTSLNKSEEAKVEAATKAPAKKKFTATKIPDDLTDAYITMAILAIAAILFFTEFFPLPVTAMLVPCALNLFGILTPAASFAAFGNTSVIIFMAMFIVGEGAFATGFANKVGTWTVKLAKGNETKILLYSIISVGFLSAFLSNTGTTAVALPMIIGMCAASKINPSKILIPVAFAASMGGTMTLVGTPPNLLINAALGEMGGAVGVQPFGFFEFGLFGLPLLIMGIIFYATIGKKFLPNTVPDAETLLEVKEKEGRVMRTAKMPIAIAIFAFVVIAMASKIMPLATAAMLGAMLMIITGCVKMKEAFRSVDWTTIFLFAGMLSVSVAMQKTGAAALIATSVVEMVSNPYAILAVSCGLTAIITNFMSNTATAALLAPLAIPIAIQSGISPLPIAMGIAMSASACFLTPIATPPNTLVFGPGNYKFIDYIKAGWLLQILSFVLCMILIPLIWPF